jgi:uncharacterized phiE125 gp8 family phage protein
MRVTNSDEDALIEGLIAAATSSAEQFTNRKFVQTTLELRADSFPADYAFIDITVAPLQSVQQISYIDNDGTLTEAELTDFEVIAPEGDFAEPGSVGPKVDKAWPTATSLRPLSARVRFIAGYGTAADVPKAIKQAILMMVGDMYENRESKIVGTIATENKVAQDLLFPYKVFYL